MFNSATTLVERVRLAKSYVDRYNQSPMGFWIGLGKPDPWPDDSNPPLPLESINKVPRLFKFIYVHSCKNVYEDTNGSIVTKDKNFTEVDSSDLYTLTAAKANKVYIEAIVPPLSPEEFSYRILGLCVDVEVAVIPSFLTAGYMLEPNLILSYSVAWVKMGTPTVVSPLSSHVIQIVREF
jgi:hypothetical protein